MGNNKGWVWEEWFEGGFFVKAIYEFYDNINDAFFIKTKMGLRS